MTNLFDLASTTFLSAKVLFLLSAIVCSTNTLAQNGSASLSLTDQKGVALTDAVVTFSAVAKHPTVLQESKAVIDQINKEFEPQVSVVQAGTAISFPNNDNILHHVYSFSKTKSFDLPLYAGTPSEPVVFDTPGLVTLGCNIHDWMRAYVVVVDTPFYEISNHNGSVEISDIPFGEYVLEVWHPRQRKPFKDTVNIGEGYSLNLEIATKPQLRSRRHSSGKGSRYKP